MFCLQSILFTSPKTQQYLDRGQATEGGPVDESIQIAQITIIINQTLTHIHIWQRRWSVFPKATTWTQLCCGIWSRKRFLGELLAKLKKNNQKKKTVKIPYETSDFDGKREKKEEACNH